MDIWLCVAPGHLETRGAVRCGWRWGWVERAPRCMKRERLLCAYCRFECVQGLRRVSEVRNSRDGIDAIMSGSFFWPKEPDSTLSQWEYNVLEHCKYLEWQFPCNRWEGCHYKTYEFDWKQLGKEFLAENKYESDNTFLCFIYFMLHKVVEETDGVNWDIKANNKWSIPCPLLPICFWQKQYRHVLYYKCRQCNLPN